VRGTKCYLYDFIGYDWGGGIGISFAVLFPKLVRKLVLFLPNFREIPDIRGDTLIVLKNSKSPETEFNFELISTGFSTLIG